MQDDEADRLDTAWGLTPDSRLGCQAVITGDLVCELPMYTRNYVQEGGGIQLGKSERRDRKAQEVMREVDRLGRDRDRPGGEISATSIR